MLDLTTQQFLYLIKHACPEIAKGITHPPGTMYYDLEDYCDLTKVGLELNCKIENVLYSGNFTKTWYYRFTWPTEQHQTLFEIKYSEYLP